MTRRFHILSLLSFVILLIVPSGSLRAQSVDDVLQDLRTKYDAMTSLKATFHQTTSSSYIDTPEEYRGHIVMVGDSFRIEMPDQTIVSDTKTTWVHNKGENQVLVNDFVDDGSTFSLSRFLSEFDTAYQVERFESGAAGSVLTLTPFDPLSEFQSVTIWVRSQDHVVTRLDVIDVNDVEMRFELTDIVFNAPIAVGTFEFETPDGVEVVDLREN